MAGRRRHAPLDNSGLFMKACIRYEFRYLHMGSLVRPRDEQAVTAVDDGLGDAGDLIGGLALPEHDLRKTLADGAVVVNAREAEKLVKVATTLRPDAAGFAVQGPRAQCPLDAAELEEIKRRLAAVDVEFVLWTSDDPDQWRRPNDIPIAYGRTMDWSGW